MKNNLLKIHRRPSHFRISQTILSRLPPFPHPFSKLPFQSSSLALSKTAQYFKFPSLSKSERLVCFDEEQEEEEEREGPSHYGSLEFEELASEGVVCRKTLKLVECYMFAAVTGLVYFLSNSLPIELTHGILGFTMGSLWRLGADWNASVVLCTIARSMGAIGYVYTTFLIRESILALITINIHASLGTCLLSWALI